MYSKGELEYKKTLHICLIVWLLSAGCSDVKVGGFNHSGDTSGDGSDTDTNTNTDTDTETESALDSDSDSETSVATPPSRAELWYAVEDILVYIEIDASTGNPIQVLESELVGDVELLDAFNSITMLHDGSLMGARLQGTDQFTTQLYRIPNPPRDGSPAEFIQIGIMPNNIGIEALYTDCNGWLYGMDTGENYGTADGNRLIRFNDNYLAGAFTFDIVTDLSAASAADVDDLSPGIDSDGRIADNPGFALDSQNIYYFNFKTGTGSRVAQGGDWGIHALGGALFDDGVSRLYLLSQDAELFLMDVTDYSLSDALIQGPQDIINALGPGYSGLAGPLVNCETSFLPAM